MPRKHKPAALLPVSCYRIGNSPRLTLPIEIISILNLSHGNRFVHSERKNKQKAEVARHIDKMAPYPNRPIDVTLTRLGPRALDDDNNTASFKYVRDAVAEALGIKDHRYELIRFTCDQERSEDYGVRITLRTREAEPLKYDDGYQELTPLQWGLLERYRLLVIAQGGPKPAKKRVKPVKPPDPDPILDRETGVTHTRGVRGLSQDTGISEAAIRANLKRATRDNNQRFILAALAAPPSFAAIARVVAIAQPAPNTAIALASLPSTPNDGPGSLAGASESAPASS